MPRESPQWRSNVYCHGPFNAILRRDMNTWTGWLFVVTCMDEENVSTDGPILVNTVHVVCDDDSMPGPNPLQHPPEDRVWPPCTSDGTKTPQPRCTMFREPASIPATISGHRSFPCQCGAIQSQKETKTPTRCRAKGWPVHGNTDVVDPHCEAANTTLRPKGPFEWEHNPTKTMLQETASRLCSFLA